MEKSLIGRKYVPLDNSWCINLETQNDAYIVTYKHDGFIYSGRVNPKNSPNSELNSEFVITSEPYEVEVGNFSKKFNFINIQSINSNKKYRTLFFKHRVL